MQNREINKPYQELGDFLRNKREKNHESILDVSEAVEIEPRLLEVIESGSDRPAEDILVLLINHFNLKDNDALTVWKLADYDNNAYDFAQSGQQVFKSDIVSGASVVMVMPIDVRPMYSDHVEVVVGPSGLVINFNQNLANNQLLPISRIGVSFEQANNILKSLEAALLKVKYDSGPKKLNSDSDKK